MLKTFWTFKNKSLTARTLPLTEAHSGGGKATWEKEIDLERTFKGRKERRRRKQSRAKIRLVFISETQCVSEWVI